MRLGGRLAAAIEILDDIENRHRPAAEALKDWGVSHRFAGSGDRAAIGNIVYDALRRRRSAASMMGDGSSRAIAIGGLLTEWPMSPAALNEALDGDRFAPPPLTETELARIAAFDPAAMPDGDRADCPAWCEPLLEAAYGDDWIEEGRALGARPPLDLRVNTLKASKDKVLRELSRTGASETALAAQGLRIAPVSGGGRHPNVQAEPAFQKGWFEVQDEGSQLAAALAGAAPGMQVLDYCAGAGGKTLALSAAMENRGQIHAHDADRLRLAPIFDRLKRAGCRNVQVIADPKALEPHAGQFDLVLVDAPCTGSGTWRRKPDAKWRLTERQLEARVADQTAILESASRFVRPGGHLVYVTCSVFRAENHDRIAAFLASRPEFAPADHAARWAEIAPSRQDKVRIDPLGLSLSPARSGTDGFFVSVMARG